MNNDLISRKELKRSMEILFKLGGYDSGLVMNTIDNVPSVEYTFEEAFQKTVCENRLYCPARPKGEWIVDKRTREVVCSYCGQSRRDTRTIHIYFCNHCGADMRGTE